MFDWMTLIIIVLIILTFLFIMFWYFNQRLNVFNQQDIKQELRHLQQLLQQSQTQIDQTLHQSNKHVQDTLQQSYKDMQQRLENSAKVMGELKEETGKMSEIGRSMKQLHELLRSPKLRGNIGEQILQDLLSQMLPPQSFNMQFRFETGEIVDAIIITQAGKIPIDAKFPFENYSKLSSAVSDTDRNTNRKEFAKDVKKHIKSISTKYIKPQQGTVDFAVMYIPSESIYYEIITNHDSLYNYSQYQRVLMVSPSTFYAFLRTILFSFEGQRIAKEAKLVLQNLRSIQQISRSFGEKLSILSRHLTHAHNTMSIVNQDFSGLRTTIDRTQLPLKENSTHSQLVEESSQQTK